MLIARFTMGIAVVAAVLAARTASADVVFELETARIALRDGGAAALTFADGPAWPATGPAAFMVETEVGPAASKQVTLKDDNLRVEFTNGAVAEFTVARHRSFVLLRLRKLTCDEPVKRLEVFALAAPAGAAQIPSLGAAQAGEHVAAVMVAEPNVESIVAAVAARDGGENPTQAHVQLRAQTVARHGIEPATVAVIACPAAEMMETIQRAQEAAGLPSPRLDGQWNKTSDAVRRSYLFLTSFKESQFDQALAIARRGGFSTILLGQESWCHSTGHYGINLTNFPDGLEGLRRTIARFQEAGFRVGLHFLAASIYPPDPYLTPVPDARLVKGATTELVDAIDAKSDVLPVKSLDGFPAEDGGYTGDGTVVQIGEELIHYTGQTKTPTPRLLGCRRGHLGTRATAHGKGSKIQHLARSYGYHMFDMDTSLLDEVTTNFARVANACRIDMIYFDGAERLQGDHWYYNAKLLKAFHDKLDNKDTLLQASSFTPYSWHLVARSASADGHGDIKGYLDERSPWFDNLARGGMPLDIGWYYGYDPSATPDMFEYVLGTTIGYGASMSYQVSVDASASHPFGNEILDLIARYEKLRLSGQVDDAMRERLRVAPALRGSMPAEQRTARLDQRREYRLIEIDGKEAFQRVIYGDWHEVNSSADAKRAWPVTFRSAGLVGVQVHSLGGSWLQAGPSYGSPDAVMLESFDDIATYKNRATLDGVTHRLEPLNEGAAIAGRGAVYTATSTRDDSGGWSVVGKAFDPPLNLSTHKGIGFWLKGDGNGGSFKLQLGDGKGATDYYIRNDYTGWAYHQLPRPQTDPIDYAQVRSLMFYYNGLPAKATVSCGIDDVKALAKIDMRTLTDPWVKVGDHRFRWKGPLGDGEYVTLLPAEPARRHAPQLAEPQTGDVVEPRSLDAGEHRVSLGAAGGIPGRLRVRVILQPDERYPIK